MSESEHEHGMAKFAYPLDQKHEVDVKKAVKEGKAVDASSGPETTSTETPDPNVESVGDTLSATDTATTDTTTTVTDTGATSTTSGTSSARTGRSGRSFK